MNPQPVCEWQFTPMSFHVHKLAGYGVYFTYPLYEINKIYFVYISQLICVNISLRVHVFVKKKVLYSL